MRRSLLTAICTLALASGIGRAHATAYTFTTFQDPVSGANLPAMGINDLGQIVLSVDAGLPTQANYLYSAGTFTPITVPDFSTTGGETVTGINDKGQITGYTGYVYSVSFVDTNGAFTPLPYAGSNFGGDQLGFQASQINDSGDVLGRSLVITSNPTGHGGAVETYVYSLYNGTSLTGITIPGLGGPSLGSFNPLVVNGINDAGELVGTAPDPATQYNSFGFLDNAGVITPISVPGAYIDTTTPFAISNSGLIAGTYYNATGIHIFLDDNGNYSTVTSFSVPSPLYGTYDITSINDAGDLIIDGGLATPVAVPEPGSVTLLGTALAALGFAARRRCT